MTKNYLQLEMGGQKRGLKFNLGTARTIGKILGIDPFTYATNTEDYDKFMNDLGTIIYAGLLSNAQSKKVDPDFTVEDAMRWADELENVDDAIDIIKAFRGVFQTRVVPLEGNGHTQLQATDVA